MPFDGNIPTPFCHRQQLKYDLPIEESCDMRFPVLASSICFLPGIKPLEIADGQLVEGDLAQLGTNVQAYLLLVVAPGIGPKPGLDGLIPKTQPISEGHIRFGLGWYRECNCGLQRLAFLHTLALGLGKHIFGFGEALLVISKQV